MLKISEIFEWDTKHFNWGEYIDTLQVNRQTRAVQKSVAFNSDIHRLCFYYFNTFEDSLHVMLALCRIGIQVNNLFIDIIR